MPSTVRHANALALRGLPVFPIERGTKNVIIQKDWAKGGATREGPDIFDRFYTGANIGCLTTGFLVLDFDAHKGGLETLSELLPLLPATYVQSTPNGGQHWVYRLPEGVEVANSVELIGKGTDVRGKNGFILGAGSEFAGKLYEVIREELVAEAPQWLIERAQAAPKKDETAAKVIGELDTPAAVQSAKDYLANSAHVSIAGSGGNKTLYAVAASVITRGCSTEKTVELLLGDWNERCDPPWSPEELEQTVSNAWQYRQSAAGRDNPAAGFSVIDPADVPEHKTYVPLEPDELDACLQYPSDISQAEIVRRQSDAILKGYMGPCETGTMYGVSGGGKSFVALDMAYRIALGLDYLNEIGKPVKVRRTPVLYVALEGEWGFEKRELGILKELGDPGKWFARLLPTEKMPVITLNKTPAGDKCAKHIRDVALHLQKQVNETTCIVVIDTKARATAGDDENSAGDMSVYMEARAGQIAKGARAFVLTVHHENKSGGMRGSTVQFAADDLVLHVVENQVIATKVKDGKGGVLFDFALQEREIDKEADGTPIVTCVVKKSPPSAKSEKKKERRKPEKRPIKILREALNAVAKDKQNPDGPGVLKAAPELDVRARFRKLYGGKPETQTDKFSWAIDNLPDDIRVAFIDGVSCLYETKDWGAA
jgi:hypothetical protein